MRALKNFGMFWYDFIVGDDPLVAAGVVVALGVSALLVHEGLNAWWLTPVVVALLLASTLARAVRKR